MNSHADSSAPLYGLIVVSVEQAVAAAFATRQLADLGATVIKIERPEGDFARHYDATVHGQSAFFVWANRGKNSVVLDLKNEQDHATLMSLIAGADVFVHNIAPVSATNLKISAEQLRSHLPHLIACDISGYGNDGPRHTDKAYDLAIQAEAGVFSVTGDLTMSKVGLSIADISAGMYALTSILAALIRRDRTNEGAAIEVSMLESLAEWIAAPMYATVYSGSQPARNARRHHSICPYGTFSLSDGNEILIAVQNDRDWLRLVRDALEINVLAKDDALLSNAARIDRVDFVESEIQNALNNLEASVARELLLKHGIAIADVNDLNQLWNHEQLRERQRFELLSLPDGTAEVLRSPFNISDWQSVPSYVPDLNQHDKDLIQSVIDRGKTRP